MRGEPMSLPEGCHALHTQTLSADDDDKPALFASRA